MTPAGHAPVASGVREWREPLRTMTFGEARDLVTGGSYVLLLDPEGVLALTDLAGNPFTRFYVPFDVP